MSVKNHNKNVRNSVKSGAYLKYLSSMLPENPLNNTTCIFCNFQYIVQRMMKFDEACMTYWIFLPKSRVIPRSLLCGFLSKAAVEAVVLKALAGERQIIIMHKDKLRVSAVYQLYTLPNS